MSEHTIYSVKGESEELKAAVASARTTFKFFWRELSWESRRIVKCLDLAAVKLSFTLDPDDPQIPAVENMWVGNVEFDGQTITGVLMNEPRWATSLQASDTVSLPFEALNDWMYVRNGHVYGGFTVDALRAGMSEDARDEHDRAWGLDFGTPGLVEVVPAPDDQQPWLLSRNLDSAEDRQTLATLEHTEHPMALDMREKVEEGLQEHPHVIHDYDPAGWLMLHREVLAGNYPVVAALLRHGADPLAPNVHGQTSLALASAAGWPRIVDLLQRSAPEYHGQVPSRGFPLWPIGFALMALGLGWLYYLVIHPLQETWGGRSVEIARSWDFLGAVMVLGYGIVSGTGPWYFRLRMRTPQWGGSRVLDLIALLIGAVIAFTLHDQLQHYVIGFHNSTR
ncbi:DUF2314 domain-containing protein [Pseudomonas sp. efr-133-TYG-103a]|jgi:uncharacterized protein YegJ (DUF2314 family)|uniref:DUF2314 domain-containing protein n=1 Tax=Pseudomonas sp. efr-133-TYG-103a TaxID=3040308 RepID=UPI00255716DD|nr:DUF2314 domain-containing protein [Pseudomonas sp. efr-133-TYG-103a]